MELKQVQPLEELSDKENYTNGDLEVAQSFLRTNNATGDHQIIEKDKEIDTENNDYKEMDIEEPVLETDKSSRSLVYGVNDVPPIHVTLVCAMQQSLSALASQLLISLLVADAVCAGNNDVFKARLLSSTLLMNGVTTLAMNLLGIRLPIFQGGTAVYVVPLLLVSDLEETFCTGKDKLVPTTINLNTSMANTTMETITADDIMDRIVGNVRMLQGSLMIAGTLHALIGATGLVGILLRFIGPLTIVPTMILIFVFYVKTVLKFILASWAISFSTVGLAMILFLYLGKYNTPVPIWTPSGGFRIIRYPVHQMFAILISMVINWLICWILTVHGVFPNDPNDPSFSSRTDARSEVIYNSPWFSLPYPGQYGPVGFSPSAMLAFLVATFLSILDSIGDYAACARVCRVPPPPPHGVNRGIMVEGICTMLSGAVGCGHATSTYGICVGGIGVSKVASRRVFMFVGLIYIGFGVFCKFCAVFITIPYPILGGCFILMVGMVFGVIIGNLEVTNMSSSRNIAILGISVFIGIAIPTWAQSMKLPINTGYLKVDKLLSMFLKNPNICGSLIACFLDNTVPGQYGPVGFSPSAMLAFLVATFLSILDSIGDYAACARVCRVPPPPSHGVNRGIMVEGICTMLSGAVGCGHATSTYGICVGGIGVSKVASRRVFMFVGLIYIGFGVFCKFCAVFITIPYPILGGCFILMVGMVFGVIIGNLEVTNMSSSRNIAILGISVFIGIAIPTWAQSMKLPINTGYLKVDKLLSMFLKNPNICGSLIACFLDNTVPGTKKERGMLIKDDEEVHIGEGQGQYYEGQEVYYPILPRRMLTWKIMKYIPIFPYLKRE